MSNDSLHKIEVSYNQTHDRLILILHTQSMNEYLFWLTRRAVPMLWKILIQLIESDKKVEAERTKEKEKWAEAIQKEANQKNPVAEQMSTRVSKRPMGNEPQLLAKIQAGTNPDGTFKLRLEDINGGWIECAGQVTILIPMCQLIAQTAAKADWNLDLKLPE